MSFKREANSEIQENLLKKRRVTDLLSSFIPDDEAMLMKNGRYTCLVCSYRPVFDTVDMLTVHRKGKKHLEGMKYCYGKKTQLKNEMAKRQHENYVQAEDGIKKDPPSYAPLLTQTRKLTHNALMKTASSGSTTTSSTSSKHPNTEKKCDSEQCQETEHVTPGRRREMEHYLKLKSAGWLQDKTGRWLKDENVEFDSDEEGPSALPPQ
ncbi:sodium channel modifier 1 [Aplochiton taeniatus]